MPYDAILDAGCSVPNLGEIGGLVALDKLVAVADFIVLDNLSSMMMTGAENDAESWSLFNSWLLRQRAARRAVLVVHHAGKGGQQRGTSRRSDALDFVLKLTRPHDYRASDGARFTLEFEKNRGAHGEAVEPFEAWLMPDPEQPDRLTWACSESRDENLMDRILRAYREGARGPSAIAALVDSNKGTVSRYLKRAKELNLMGTILDD
ncbi:MAG: AAA family ATPase [Gammaproteobacteria bacterium]|nr:AAA family ATPase [Gammaproteobacteria bacterium]